VLGSHVEDGILGERDGRLVVNLEHHLLSFAVAKLGQQPRQPDPLASSCGSSHVL
jgi:hypothetical protein